MQVPAEIRFHQYEPPPGLEDEIRSHIEKLDRLYGRLTACRVAVEAQHRQHQTGNVVDIHIELSVPGGSNVVISREPHRAKEKYARPDVHTAVRDAFKAAEHQLKARKAKLLGDVKPPGAMLAGTIANLEPEQDFGFLLTPAGVQLYFNRTSLMDCALEELKPGGSVHYIQIDGASGPIANKVWRSTPPDEE